MNNMNNMNNLNNLNGMGMNMGINNMGTQSDGKKEEKFFLRIYVLFIFFNIIFYDFPCFNFV
jgi:hypothetical protein